ncbi:5'3'-exonuclease N- and I-domain-containing protein [Cavenderia fasciculata]|uniref:5'3'-exonuclease N-and I-domain-containing protein n=1 Tax=Cavenderia fasciculata TaxID=261658 RepID=F4Q0V7_CACFS|nr:5'3'-exonuclease N- and I-domain-containing protein [Cavenderia fasciculata]EGG18458.1 5'3'-exonuclease N- and I-domain-containing protein [Cavenderia fasciculata]|eukprot:XP_004366362.1 5'3'-exonuclease N- and I-domain-containing protein [Cavenderia fasciculata]
MPVPRFFQDFIEKYLNTSKLSLLNENRVGIDAIQWLLKLHLKEPFQTTMGGSPLTMITVIQEELEKIKKSNIKPFFVFPGLSILKDRPQATTARAQKLSIAWDAYYKGQYEFAESQFSDSERVLLVPFIQSIISYFKQQNIEFFKAPFFLWAQLALFSDPSQKNYLNAVWGGYESLLFGIHRLIVDIDFDKGVFFWIDLKAILNELALTHDQFVDAILLCGYEFCPLFPHFINNNFGPQLFRVACDLVRQHQTGIAVIQDHFHMYPLEKYMEQFMKTKCLLRNHMIYTPSCHCEPLYRDLAYQVKPTDLNSIFGPKLPNDLYFYISQGAVSPQVVNNLISGILIEPFPTVESEEFRRMLEYLKDVRAKTLGLLSACLGDDIHNKVVKNIRWYEPKDFEIPHATILNSTPFGRANNSKSIVIPNEIKQQLQQQTKSNLPITFQFVAACSSSNPLINNNNNNSNSNNNNQEPIVPIKDSHEANFYIMYQSLSIMGYIGNDGKLTAYGRVLEQLKKSKFQEEIILAIELMRSNCLSTEKLTFIPKPSFEGPSSNNTTALLSRLLSLLPCKLDNTPWSGPIDHDLMAFHEIARTLYKTLRNLIEITATSHFLTHRIVFEPNEYFNFSTKLPFFLQSNASMGLMVKGTMLEGLGIEDMKDIFPNCIDIEHDLERATQFLEEIVSVLPILVKENLIDKSLHESFIQANEAWKKCRLDQIDN